MKGSVIFLKNEAGSCVWFIPDCFYPDTNSPGHYVSHEAICVLNTGNEDANIKITLYFEDREPIEGYTAQCNARRTNHIRMDKIKDAHGNGIPCGVPYAAMVESDKPVIVQYSRLDTTQAEMSLMTAIAYHL